MRILEGETAFCFTPSHNGLSDHKFTVGTSTAFYFSVIMQEEGKEKSVFVMLSWGLSICSVYMGAILLYGSVAETLKHECSEGENINCSVVMKFYCI